MIPQRCRLRSILSLHSNLKVKNAYWTREVLTDGPVSNWSFIVNVACQSDSSTENAYESDRFKFSTNTTNYIDDSNKSTAAASEAEDASFWWIIIFRNIFIASKEASKP